MATSTGKPPVIARTATATPSPFAGESKRPPPDADRVPSQRHPAEVPAGYPCDFERQLQLADGRWVFVRPVIPSDQDRLRAAIVSADRETLRRRFLGGTPAVTAQLLTRLTTLDYVRRFALVAAEADSGRGVAIARYEVVDGDRAEVAVVVDPAWRRAGLATALIESLAHAALHNGIHTFCATYLAENRPVAALVDRAGGSIAIRLGITEALVGLDQACDHDSAAR